MSRAVNALVMVAVIVATVLVSIPFLRGEAGEEKEDVLQPVAWDLTGFSSAGVEVRGNALVLKANCHELSVYTTEQQALSASLGLQKKVDGRPLSHDILADSLDFFGVEVVMAKLSDLKGGTYYARLVMRQGDQVLEIDSRPSDAIAVAVRAGAPVYVKDSLLENFGDKVC